MPANRLRSIKPNRRKAYEAMKGKMPKRVAAAIANAGATKAGRSRMAKKAAKSKKRK